MSVPALLPSPCHSIFAETKEGSEKITTFGKKTEAVKDQDYYLS